MNALILDGNENQAVACVRSLARAGHSVCVGSSSTWSKAGMSRWSKESFVYPDPHDDTQGFFCSILEQLRKWPRALVLPMTERTTLPLSLRRDEIFTASGLLILPPHDAVIRAFDKAETTTLAQTLGIQVPTTILAEASASPDTIVRSLRFPVVLKPRSSFEVAASGNVVETGRSLYASNAAEFVPAWRKLSQHCSFILVQEFVAGEGTGYFALFNHGFPRAEFAHARIRDVHPTGSGSSLRMSIPLDPALRDAGRRILQELRWHGVAMVEFRRRHDGTLVFMEVNGRFWNSLALAIYAGVDFPAMLAEMVEKGDVAPSTSYRESVRCRWLVGDFRHLVEVWKGAPLGFPESYPGRLISLIKFMTPVRGTFHDNFMLSDPLPELGDWMDLVFRRIPSAWKKSVSSQ